MPRSRATIYCSIHGDPGWLARSPEAKLTYLTVLSQSGLTLAGCVDYHPTKWSQHTGYDQETLDAALSELIDSGFLAVDEDTFECVIVNFTKWDVGADANRNTVQGMWKAWKAILSPRLRQIVLNAMPSELFTSVGTPDDCRTLDRTVVPTVDRTVDGTTVIEDDSETCRSDDIETVDRTVDPTPDGTVVPTVVPTTSSASSSSSVSTTSQSCPNTTSKALVVVDDLVPPPAKRHTLDEAFDAFWSDYPRKEAKKDARRAWDVARKSATIDEIHGGLRRQLPAMLASDPDLVKLPAGWLRGGRWADENVKPKTRGAPSRAASNRQALIASARKAGVAL